MKQLFLPLVTELNLWQELRDFTQFPAKWGEITHFSHVKLTIPHNLPGQQTSRIIPTNLNLAMFEPSAPGAKSSNTSSCPTLRAARVGRCGPKRRYKCARLGWGVLEHGGTPEFDGKFHGNCGMADLIITTIYQKLNQLVMRGAIL